MPKIVDVMIDIETLGTVPGSVILSIGASAVAPDYEAACERKISIASALHAGLKIDEDTLAWWRKQDVRAWNASTNGQEDIDNALAAFWRWFDEQRKWGDVLRVWGDGAIFDMGLIEAAYRVVGGKPPWKYGEVHCYRTLRQLMNSPKPKLSDGEKHTALADARSQMIQLQQLLGQLSYFEAEKDARVPFVTISK